MTPYQEIRLAIASNIEDVANALTCVRDSEGTQPGFAASGLADADLSLADAIQGLCAVREQISNLIDAVKPKTPATP